MITWRQIRDELNGLSEKQLDMAASVYVSSHVGETGGWVVDPEDGIEIYSPNTRTADNGVIPGLVPDQPFLYLDIDA